MNSDVTSQSDTEYTRGSGVAILQLAFRTKKSCLMVLRQLSIGCDDVRAFAFTTKVW